MAYDETQQSYHMLICLIEVWNPKDGETPQKLMMPTRKADFMIAEVQSLEIRESYRDVVGSANIKFPRGTVIKKTIEATDPSEYSSAVTADISSQGAIIETRTNSEVAQTSNFSVGSRIRIYLGYTTDPKVYQMPKVSTGKASIFSSEQVYNDYKGYLTVMFEGYITKCSLDTPIEIECEDLAHLLKCVACKKITTTNKTTVKELLYKKGKDKGIHGLLENTGLMLHPETEDIVIGKCSITTDFTPFDILNQWHKWKIYAFLAWDNNGNPCIAVRNTYFSGGEGSLIAGTRMEKAIPVDFQYNVAENGLELMKIDDKSIAIQATCKDTDGKKTTTLTLMRNPSWDGDSSSDKWRVVNETKISKKQMKKRHIKMVSDEAMNTRLSEYAVIEYQSRKIGLTHKQLLDEAIAFYEGYNQNGVDGTLTLFGDLKIRTTDIVDLQDARFSQKNGKYLVEEVITKFGTNGFRQTIKLPYCLQRDADNQENSSGNGE